MYCAGWSARGHLLSRPSAPLGSPLWPGGLPEGLEHLPLDQGGGEEVLLYGAVLPQVRRGEEVEEGGVPAEGGPGGPGGEGGVWGGPHPGGGMQHRCSRWLLPWFGWSWWLLLWFGC